MQNLFISTGHIYVNNRLPSVDNGSHNGIHCHQQVAIIYKLSKYITLNNNVARLMTRIMLFICGMQDKIDNRKTCTCFASHFNGHADQAVQC